MANPARALRQVAEAILTDEARKRRAQGFTSPPSTRERRLTSIAARLLTHIEQVLTQMSTDFNLSADYAQIRRFLDQSNMWWATLVVLPPNATDGFLSLIDRAPHYGEAEQHPTPEELTVLAEIDQLADFLESRIWHLDSKSESTLIDGTQQMRRILVQDDALSPELKLYLSRLIDQIEHAVNDAHLGAVFDFADAITQLLIGLKAAAGERTSKREAWRTVYLQIVAGVTVNALTWGAPAILAIGGG